MSLYLCISINFSSDFQLRSRMILQVHDELVFDVYLPELERMKEIVKYEMEHVMELNVPLLVEMGSGKNWFEAH